MKIEAFANYGVLAHEKLPVYTTAINCTPYYDKIILDIPFDCYLNSYCDYIVRIDGEHYELSRILVSMRDGNPALRWVDRQGNHCRKLRIVKEGVKGC